ncbi:hypothetical protein [Sinorhizobium chiapasense]|uniref:Uncharacterized protein n=1 Tax=Sinorhizobium chiapasense TaxID=501572 RepID=A0ABZ2BDY3_9HYPH
MYQSQGVDTVGDFGNPSKRRAVCAAAGLSAVRRAIRGRALKRDPLTLGGGGRQA